MRLNNLGFILIFLTLIILNSENINALTPPYYRAPDYDSWWLSLTPDAPITLTHNLGGDAGDYIVDLTMQPAGTHPSWKNAHINGLGGDTYTDTSDNNKIKKTGAAWYGLTDTKIELIRYLEDTHCDFGRVRIWKTCQADYDSGWITTVIGDSIKITHSLEGDVNNYIVDLRFLDSNPGSSYGYHNMGYGGDSATNIGGFLGAFWDRLDATQIFIFRDLNNTSIGKARVRIWKNQQCPVNSGWQSFLSTGNSIVYQFAGLGPFFDYVVLTDIKYPASNNLNGRGIGGDVGRVGTSSIKEGVYWEKLEHSTLTAVKGASEIYNTINYRVRMIGYNDPRFDSGWRPVLPNEQPGLLHNIGGYTSDFLVDTQFKSNWFLLGVNCWGFGGDYWYYNNDLQLRGGYWHKLTTGDIRFIRFVHDTSIDNYRIRIWVTAPPDYDTGMQPIDKGQTLTIDPGLGTSSQNWFVELKTFDTHTSLFGEHCLFRGSDSYNSTSGLKRQGAVISAIEGDLIKVTRLDQDDFNNKFQVRVWKTALPAYISPNTNQGAGQLLYYPHQLGRNPDTYVVDLRFRIPGTPNRDHYIGMGGDIVEQSNSGATVQGADWRLLSDQGLWVWREPQDTGVQQIYYRLYSVGAVGKSDLADHIAGRHILKTPGFHATQGDFNKDGNLDVGDIIAGIRCGYTK